LKRAKSIITAGQQPTGENGVAVRQDIESSACFNRKPKPLKRATSGRSNAQQVIVGWPKPILGQEDTLILSAGTILKNLCFAVPMEPFTHCRAPSVTDILPCLLFLLISRLNWRQVPRAPEAEFRQVRIRVRISEHATLNMRPLQNRAIWKSFHDFHPSTDRCWFPARIIPPPLFCHPSEPSKHE
jgi:hypothetical protein